MQDSTIYEIRKGLLVLAVLRVISRKKAYSAEILLELGKTDFSTQEGTLYPLLSRLKREGYIEHEWVESAGGPPRKYYFLSVEGKRRTQELMDYIKSLETQLIKLGSNKYEHNGGNKK